MAEPGWLWRRYLVLAPRFLFLLMFDALRKRKYDQTDQLTKSETLYSTWTKVVGEPSAGCRIDISAHAANSANITFRLGVMVNTISKRNVA